MTDDASGTAALIVLGVLIVPIVALYLLWAGTDLIIEAIRSLFDPWGE